MLRSLPRCYRSVLLHIRHTTARLLGSPPGEPSPSHCSRLPSSVSSPSSPHLRCFPSSAGHAESELRCSAAGTSPQDERVVTLLPRYHKAVRRFAGAASAPALFTRCRVCCAPARASRGRAKDSGARDSGGGDGGVEDAAQMSDEEIAKAASKLLSMLAPKGKGMQSHTALAAATASPVKKPAYITPPSARKKHSEGIVERESEASASTMPMSEASLKTLRQMPSRRTHILSRAEQREFDEAFAAAEAILKEQESNDVGAGKNDTERTRATQLASQVVATTSSSTRHRSRKAQHEEESLEGAEAAELAAIEHENPLLAEVEPEVDALLPLLEAAEQQQRERETSTLMKAETPSYALTCLPSTVANPFKGLHEYLRRSYRLDEVLLEAKPESVVLAKQDQKTSVFSYLTLEAGIETYQKHWEVKQALRDHHLEPEESSSSLSSSVASGAKQQQVRKTSSAKSKDLLLHSNDVDDVFSMLEGISSSGEILPPLERSSKTTTPAYVLADPVQQWGGLGWEHTLIDVDYSLLLAQRVLLFPSSQRYFHALCGRKNVPCDFFADLDLHDVTMAEAEKILVEVLDYLEIRLPGVGFTDPFFLILTNESPEEMIIPLHPQGASSASSSPAPGKKQHYSKSQLKPSSSSASSASGTAADVKRKKVSFHLHARSMTHVHTRAERPMEELLKPLQKPKRGHKNANAVKKSSDSEEVLYPLDGTDDVPSWKGEAENEEAIPSQRAKKKGGRSTRTSGGDTPRKSSTGGGPQTTLLRGAKGATKMIAFQDYRSVKLIADEINQTFGFSVVDEACYRTHGSLRCAFSRKAPPTAASSSALLANSSPSGVNSSPSAAPSSVASGEVAEASANAALVRHNIQPALVPLQIHPQQNPTLQRKLQDMHEVLHTLSAPEILALTFCTRHLHQGGVPTLKTLQAFLVDCSSGMVAPQPTSSLSDSARKKKDSNSSSASEVVDSNGGPGAVSEAVFRATTLHSFKLVKPFAIVGPQAAAQLQDGGEPLLGPDGAPLPRPPSVTHVEYDAYGNAVSPYLTEAAKWRRYKSVVAKLQHVPPRAATSFDIWVRIGLALHNFSNEEHVFEEWVKFSLKCPQKYSRESCRKKWLQFERNPDALNWRRGFNYLNQTLWRQL